MNEPRMHYDVDQVRERTDLLTLIGQHVVLKKRGNRHTGLCPFHQEKSASFSVDAQKGFWHCFGCGKGGDAFTFLMELEHLSFPEAVERLAERAGVRALQTNVLPRQKEERDLLYEVNAAAAAAFATALRGKAGGIARSYLENRGISLEQAARFGLGYAPKSWDALVSHLTTHGYSTTIMVKAGVALARTSGSGYIDRFRHRLMIPIYDRQGRVVGFGGRALAKEDAPKYLNTAETPIFQKNRLLYGLNIAVGTISKGDAAKEIPSRVIITEGYFDTIACHLAGFTEAVATLGTALGEEHVQLLRRLTEKVYLVFDADSAGINAALRSQMLFRKAEMDVRIVRLPAGHDPDTLLRELGVSVFEQCLLNALSPVEFELERLIQQHPVSDTESRVRLFRAAAKLLQPLSRLERTEYAIRFIDRSVGTRGDIAELQHALLSEIATLDRAPQRHNATAPAVTASKNLTNIPDVPLEREVLTAMVQNADFAQRAVQLISPEMFSHDRYRAAFIALLALAQQGKTPDARLIISENEQVATTVAALAIREPLPISGLSQNAMVERLQEEYERRQTRPAAIALNDRAALEAFSAPLRARSQRIARRIFGED